MSAWDVRRDGDQILLTLRGATYRMGLGDALWVAERLGEGPGEDL